MSAMDERPPVVCESCDFAWHSARMVEGLRLLGSCPRCGGGLHFTEPPAPAPEDDERAGAGDEPHLILGLPRPPRR